MMEIKRLYYFNNLVFYARNNKKIYTNLMKNYSTIDECLDVCYLLSRLKGVWWSSKPLAVSKYKTVR